LYNPFTFNVSALVVSFVALVTKIALLDLGSQRSHASYVTVRLEIVTVHIQCFVCDKQAVTAKFGIAKATLIESAICWLAEELDRAIRY
jgi:hypothetical protein